MTTIIFVVDLFVWNCSSLNSLLSLLSSSSSNFRSSSPQPAESSSLLSSFSSLLESLSELFLTVPAAAAAMFLSHLFVRETFSKAAAMTWSGIFLTAAFAAVVIGESALESSFSSNCVATVEAKAGTGISATLIAAVSIPVLLLIRTTRFFCVRFVGGGNTTSVTRPSGLAFCLDLLVCHFVRFVCCGNTTTSS